MTKVAATSYTGTFTQQPKLIPAWQDDPILQRTALLFAPKLVTTRNEHFSQLSKTVLTAPIFDAVVNAEHDLPYLSGSGFTSFGHAKGDSLVTSYGWRYLQDFGIRQGVVACAYDETDAQLVPHARFTHFLTLYIWGSSSALVTCPSAMQDGAVRVLLNDLEHTLPCFHKADSPYPSLELFDARTRVFRRAVERLTSRDPREAWTSGQWMTERAGGSDVRGTETVAVYTGSLAPELGTDIDGLPLGPWTVDGFKWFSSATDCGCVVLLAYTPKGLSCFFAPTRRLIDGEVVMNGIRIQRLKNKMGTKALPTAEIEIKGMRAWLIGEEGKGVPIISDLLNITRYYNAVSSAGSFGRGLAVARAFGRVRTMPSLKAPYNSLRSLPLAVRTLAKNTLLHRSTTLLSAFIAALLSAVEARTALAPLDATQTAQVLRLLTPMSKARTAKDGIHGLQECMESLGGVGYMENAESPEINVARLFRDANVLSIWEGTTDVLASDVVRVLRGREAQAVLSAMDTWVRSSLAHVSAAITTAGAEDAAVQAAWNAWLASVGPDVPKETLMLDGREIMARLGDVACAVLHLLDAAHDRDEVAVECARRFVRSHQSTFTGLVPEKPSAQSYEAALRLDQLIAYGDEGPLATTSGQAVARL